MQITISASSRARRATTVYQAAGVQNRMTTRAPVRYNKTEVRQLMDIQDFMLDGGQ
jgi:hypothetical protein